MPKYSIIIPVCNNPDLTKACLNSIAKFSKNYEVIIVDNGSNPAWSGPEFCIRNETNLGFPVAVNQGIKKSVGDVIVILNNDTVVCPDWLEHLDFHFTNYDVVGPLTNEISGLQHLIFNPALDFEKLPEVSKNIYQNNEGRSMPFFRLVFFCVAIKREVIEKIGLLDEQFSPGNFEDDDFCVRAILAGFRLGIAQDVLIYHKGSATHKSLNVAYDELLGTNLMKFKAKWPLEIYSKLRKNNLLNCSNIWKFTKRSMALVMICKNEEVGLERAIISAQNFVSEIVIAIDNSTVDKTEEIAKKYATTIKHFDWRDDFAWARNFAHEGVKSDWILFLDGHEYVEKCENLESMLDLPVDGLLCTVELEQGTQIRNPRIYRNGMKFAGAVHEMQNCKSLSVYTDFVVKHARIGGQSQGAIVLRNEQRDDQIERIMGGQLKDDPKNTRAAFHLALHQQSKGYYKKALKFQKQFLKFAINHGDRWYMLFNQALCHYSLGRSLRAFWSCNSAEKETPNRWEIAKLRGLIYFRAKDYTKAVKFFVDSFDSNINDVTFKPWKKDNVGTWNLIGECYFKTSLYDLANVAFMRASEECIDVKQKAFYKARSDVMIALLREY